VARPLKPAIILDFSSSKPAQLLTDRRLLALRAGHEAANTRAILIAFGLSKLTSPRLSMKRPPATSPTALAFPQPPSARFATRPCATSLRFYAFFTASQADWNWLFAEWHPLMLMRRWFRDLLLIFIAIPLLAQHKPTIPGASKTIRADVTLVLVSTVVTDRKGSSITGLAADQFTILEDKVPQPIVSFSKEEIPCSVGVILDLSGSMRQKLPAATAAVRAFLNGFNPEDETFLMAVSSRPESLLGFTDDAASLQNRLMATRAEGGTALIDTVYLALHRMHSARSARKALFIVSDGMDNNSRYSKAELLRTVQEQDVQVHTIGIAARSPGKKPIELVEESRGLALMTDLADRSGGLNFTVVNPEDIQPATTKIGRAVRDQYVVGYRPASQRDSGKWRSIQVKVTVPQLRAYARKGYYSN
jgi:Ca-activated chloride channel family protein